MAIECFERCTEPAVLLQPGGCAEKNSSMAAAAILYEDWLGLILFVAELMACPWQTKDCSSLLLSGCIQRWHSLAPMALILLQICQASGANLEDRQTES